MGLVSSVDTQPGKAEVSTDVKGYPVTLEESGELGRASGFLSRKSLGQQSTQKRWIGGEPAEPRAC